jgi:hypothetical protein
MTGKKTQPIPLKGEYRTLVVDVAPAEKPDPAVEEIRVPDTIAEKMARLDLAGVSPETDARRLAAAVPESDAQQALVDYFEGRGEVTAALIDVYLAETRSSAPNDLLILRYHHQGNRRLVNLIIACLERAPTDKGLLYDLAHVNGFLGDALPVIDHYCRALAMETAWPALRALADDICDHEQLMTPASRSRFQELLRDHPEKWQMIENTMARHG